MQLRSLVAALAACALTACGSDGPRSPEATKAPNAVLADAAAALHATPSYQVHGMLDPGFSIDVVITGTGSRGTITTHGVTWQQTSVAGRTWFRGTALWRATVPAATADRYGDTWVLVSDPRAGFGFAGRIAHFHESIPGVVFGPQQGLVNDGLKQLDKKDVVRLTSEEDIYDVLADPPYFPVRWLEKENPGPNGEPCGITLDHFGESASVTAPATNLELPKPR